MPQKETCFVIIGYGKKISYATGVARTLDLDQTYKFLIKPVFDALGIDCYRAIDKNLNGSIDEAMLEDIKNADFALADISTLNANVMWELGVRHALKPYHTIMICEKEQMATIPFDINSFVVQQYVHSEAGIPYTEVDRFREELTNVVNAIRAQKPIKTDSPVYTFLKQQLIFATVPEASSENETTPPVNITSITGITVSIKEELPALKMADISALTEETTSADEQSEPNADSFATMLDKAEAAKKKEDYVTALDLFTAAKVHAVKNMTLRDNVSFIVCRQALCTYQSKSPDELTALINAKNILDELKPKESQDIEVLGLSGAINKRLNELTNNTDYLNNAIAAYEKGFQLKQDYYNGINAAFMYYKKTCLLKKANEDWEDVKLKADYIRNSVLDITSVMASKEDFEKTNDAIWVVLTMAEAYNYKNNPAKMKECEDKATQLAAVKQDQFAMKSYNTQKEKITKIQNC